MKILFLGEIGIGQTSRMRMRALERLGHTLLGVNTNEPWMRAGWLQRQAQRRLQRGPVIAEINAAALRAGREFRPDLVWAEKQEFLREETLVELRRDGARLVHFTPDPYFTLGWKRTRLMDRAIKEFDVLVYCKSYERRDYEATGKAPLYMPLGFCDEVHRPVDAAAPRWTSAVGFLGGWEPRRQRLLHAIAALGIELKVWGAYWDFLSDGHWTPRRQLILRQLAGRESFAWDRDELLARAWQGGEVYAEDYARALSGAKIGIGLLRRTWPDQHTTRTFEIPACGSLLLADRTAEHCEFFTEGREAEFFSSEEELLDKVRFYSGNEPVRREIAEAGYRRCIDGRYAYIHRLRTAVEAIARL